MVGKNWVKPDAMGNTKAYGALCKKSFSVAPFGIMAMHTHAKGCKYPSLLHPPTQPWTFSKLRMCKRSKAMQLRKTHNQQSQVLCLMRL